MTSAMIWIWREPRSSATARAMRDAALVLACRADAGGGLLRGRAPWRRSPMHRISSVAALQSSSALVPTVFDDQRGQPRPGHAAEHHAAADEPEQALGLARIVDAVGERPELADEQDAEQRAPDVEGDRDPGRAGPEQEPEDRAWPPPSPLRDRQRPAPRQRADEPRVADHQHADDQARAEDDPRARSPHPGSGSPSTASAAG